MLKEQLANQTQSKWHPRAGKTEHPRHARPALSGNMRLNARARSRLLNGLCRSQIRRHACRARLETPTSRCTRPRPAYCLDKMTLGLVDAARRSGVRWQVQPQSRATNRPPRSRPQPHFRRPRHAISRKGVQESVEKDARPLSKTKTASPL